MYLNIYVHHGVTFFSAKVCSSAIFVTSFSCDKYIWIAATYYYMHFYIIILFLLTAILQLINFTASYFFSLLINAVILLLNCLVLVLYFYIHFLSLLKHYLDLYITVTALKVSRSLYCFTTSISRGVEN